MSIRRQKDKKTFDVNGTQAVVFVTDKEIIVVFRGTEPTEIKDILADLNAFQTSSFDKNGDVHLGFKNALDEIWTSLEDWVSFRRINGRKLIICGHSLGGALATIASDRFNADECYTYGSPRVGDSKWVKNFSVKHYRVVNNNDIVPKVPLWIMGYRHTCKPIYMSYTGKIVSMNFIQRFIDSVRGRFRALKKFQLFDSIYDHSMSEYIRFLRTNSK